MSSQNHWHRWLVSIFASLTMLGLVLAYSEDVVAQGKKSDESDPPAKKQANADDSKADKKDDKADGKNIEIKIPKRTDQLTPVQKAGGIEQILLIDELLAKGWLENKVQPADRCTDHTFLRRAFLDIVGRIPTLDEIRRYVADPESTRRSMLIERLLGESGTDDEKAKYSSEYAENFANMWTVMLLTRSGSQKVYQEMMHDWLTEQFLGAPAVDSETGKKKTDAKGRIEREPADWSKVVANLVSANGQTNKNGAVNFILHHLGDEIKENRAENGAWDMVPVTSRTTRLFLGVRTQCVQCHDHPFNGEWSQKHFWQINAFFRQVDTNGRPGMMAAKKKKGEAGVQNYDVKDNRLFNSDGIVSFERRNGLVLYASPTFLDGKKMPKSKDGERRQELARFITTSPYFAKAFVNRMWGHFFGKSFTKDAVDDFGDHNQVSNPELLDKLAEDFAKKYNHNPKMLIRWICNSQAYSLDSKANKTNDKPEDEIYFARMLLKPMSPEQLFESLMTATAAKAAQTKEAKRELREDWLNTLVVNFGNDEGEEGNFNGTVVQALLLMNGQDINKAITDQEIGTVAYVLKKRNFTLATAPAAIRDLYLAALSREPTQAEMQKLTNPKMAAFPRASTTPPAQFWVGYYQDIFWALLNSNEFILNH